MGRLDVLVVVGQQLGAEARLKNFSKCNSTAFNKRNEATKTKQFPPDFSSFLFIFTSIVSIRQNMFIFRIIRIILIKGFLFQMAFENVFRKSLTKRW